MGFLKRECIYFLAHYINSSQRITSYLVAHFLSKENVLNKIFGSGKVSFVNTFPFHSLTKRKFKFTHKSIKKSFCLINKINFNRHLCF